MPWARTLRHPQSETGTELDTDTTESCGGKGWGTRGNLGRLLEGEGVRLAFQVIGGADCEGSVMGLRVKVQRWGSAAWPMAMRSQILPLKPPAEPEKLPEQESEQCI